MSNLVVNSAKDESCDVSLDTTLSSSPSDDDDNTSEDSGASDVSTSFLGSLQHFVLEKHEKTRAPELLRGIFETFWMKHISSYKVGYSCYG